MNEYYYYTARRIYIARNIQIYKCVHSTKFILYLHTNGTMYKINQTKPLYAQFLLCTVIRTFKTKNKFYYKVEREYVYW